MRAELNRAVCLGCPHSEYNQPGFKGGACACTIDPQRRDIVERAKADDCERFAGLPLTVLPSTTQRTAAEPCSTCGKIAKGAIGLAKVAAQAVGIPIDVAGRKVEALRLKVCTACAPGATLCPSCDCIIAAKVKLASEACPLEKWAATSKADSPPAQQ